MDEYIYKDNINGNYYLITSIDKDFNYKCVVLNTFNNKIINNVIINNCNKIILNKDNIFKLINDFNLEYINLDDYDEYNYINYKSRKIKINNWNDFYNFIASII